MVVMATVEFAVCFCHSLVLILFGLWEVGRIHRSYSRFFPECRP